MHKPLNSTISTYASLNDTAALTYRGGVLGAIELSGAEPALLTPKEKTLLTQLLRNVIQRLPVDVTLSQYYVHSDCAPIKFRKRDNPRSQLVSERRARFLNEKRQLFQSSLVWVLEIHSIVNYSEIGGDLITLCLQAIVDKHKRGKLRRALSHRQATLLDEQELLEQCESLDEALASMMLGLSFRSLDNRRLKGGELFHLQKMLTTMEPDYLNHAASTAPLADWDRLLSCTEVEPVISDEGIHYLKLTHERTIYARIASVQGVGTTHTPECAWASDLCPVLQKGNYLYFTRFIPYSKQKKQAMVSDEENDIFRSQLGITDLIKGEADPESIRAKIEANPQLSAVLRELERISADDDKYGEWLSYIVVFDTNLPKLKQQTKALNVVLENSDFHLLWESVGLLNAYKTLLLGYDGHNIRHSRINASQAAALSLFYRSNEGFPTFNLGGKTEEALFVLESDDGVPFHYTPFIGDKCLVIGVGPTRSGKTFLKQCIANHFTKMNGMYCALDIDDGSESLARFFKEDASVFCLKDTNSTKGFNPFSMATGRDDDEFARHMMKLIRLMLQENEAQELQVLDADEQAKLEKAIRDTMGQTGKLSNFSAMLAKCPKTLKEKLAKFKRGGVYGNLFDNDEDAIGVLDKPYSVYNTQGVKDSETLAPIVNTEIFFRAVRLFESAQFRTRPKFFEIDECQYVLSQKGAAEWAIAKARTWFKSGGGMGFWTQSPKHYSDLEEWGTLRSAATTFIFMADAEMEKGEYQHAFPFLTDAELNVIQSLKPKQQAFIKQPDKGIAKVVNLFAEPEQYVVATSNPHEATIVKEVFAKEENVDIAIDEIIRRFKTELRKEL